MTKHTTTMTITDKQIEAYEDESGRFGDLRAARVARAALVGNQAARRQIANWIAEAQAQDYDEE